MPCPPRRALLAALLLAGCSVEIAPLAPEDASLGPPPSEADSGEEFVDASAHPADAASGPDGALAAPDAAEPGLDAASSDLDAASSAPDAGSPGLDAASPGLDGSEPGLDAASPGLDAASPGLDAASPGLDAAAAGPDAASPGPDAGAAPSCSNIVGTRQEQVCLRWKCDRQDMSEGTWSGNVASCEAGDLTAAARANAVRLVNLYRFLADLPAVTDDATRNAKAQECALMMKANGTLNHTPPTSWACYSADGAEAAGKSNISSGQAVSSIDLYMRDPGNSTTIGHRRWLLSNSLGPIGVGGASSYSCHWVVGGTGAAGKAFLAWPPPGPVPWGAMQAANVDSTGWTVQSDSISLSSATVSVTESGTDLPVDVTVLGANYGSKYALRFTPSGWSSQADKSYTVTLGGVASPISYTVQFVTCP